MPNGELDKKSITFILIMINVVIWIMGVLNTYLPFLSLLPVLPGTGGIYYPAVAGGQWWRIVTAMFIHGGLYHLSSNTLALFALGGMMEKHLGKKRYTVIYFASGLGGNLLVLLKDHITGIYPYTVGASGAILGIMGALLAEAVMKRGISGEMYIRRVFFASILMLIPSSPNISMAAHLGGFIFGAAAAFIMVGADRGRNIEVM